MIDSKGPSYAIRFAAIRLMGYILSFFHFRGFWRLCKLLGSFSTDNATVDQNDFRIIFPLNDPYWAQLICPQFKYEPEIEFLLLQMAKSNTFFVDCGANIGYWSLFAAKKLGIEDICCIEPNKQNHDMLIKNLSLNLVEAKVYEKAIGRIGQQSAILSVPKERGFSVASSITNSSEDDNQYEVEVISLFEILSECFQRHDSGIVKLDIEGAELSALHSIRSLLNLNLQIIFEDHGSNINSPIVNWFLVNSNYRIYFLSPQSGLLEIKSVQEANDLKSEKRSGYNFVAIPKML